MKSVLIAFAFAVGCAATPALAQSDAPCRFTPNVEKIFVWPNVPTIIVSILSGQQFYGKQP